MQSCITHNARWHRIRKPMKNVDNDLITKNAIGEELFREYQSLTEAATAGDCYNQIGILLSLMLVE